MDTAKRPTKFTLATMYGAGLTGFAPGTSGSFFAMLIAYPILAFLPYGWAVLFAGVILFTWLGTKSATRYMIAHDTAHDPGEIVIDELAGQWLTYSIWHLFLVAMAGDRDAGIALLNTAGHVPMYLILGFFLFRFFDIWKPWPIRVADRKIHGGWGVMFDDLLAAIPAGLCLYLLYLFMPLLTGTHLQSTV